MLALKVLIALFLTAFPEQCQNACHNSPPGNKLSIFTF